MAKRNGVCLLIVLVAYVALLPCVGAQHFYLPEKPRKPVKLHPLEKQWMEQGLRLRIRISSLEVRYSDSHPVMIQHVKQYVALIRELKRLRYLLDQKIVVQGFLSILLNQTLQLEMKLAAHRVVYAPKHPKMKVALVQQKLLRDRLRGWLRMQKYKGPLYPPKKKKTVKQNE